MRTAGNERDPAAYLPQALLTPPALLRPDPEAPAGGLRVGGKPDIQLICGAGPYEVDVLVRVDAPPGSLGVVGQITRADRVHEPVPSLSLVIYDADLLRPVAKAETDPFGGFDFELDQKGRYVLAMGEASDAPCILLWEGGES